MAPDDSADTGIVSAPLDPGYRIERLAESGAVTPDDVLELWARERVVKADEARRRVHEVLMVATEIATNALVGISTTNLRRVPRLGLDLWFCRVFVTADTRDANIATHLLDRSRSHHEHRFVRGEDTRGVGMILDVQNNGIKRTQNQAVWRRTFFVFIGENARHDHVRVRYFPGAVVPSSR